MRYAIGMFLLIAVFSSGSEVDAAWTGPDVIVSGAWGSGKGQFGLRSESGFDIHASIDAVLNDESIVVYDPVNKRQMVFDRRGTLESEKQTGISFSTIPHRDREARIVHSQRSGADTYRITAVFSDKNAVVTSDQNVSRAMRDAQGFVYLIGFGTIVRFDGSGRKTDVLNIPASKEELVEVPGQRAPRGVYIIYGDPVIGPSGSVYMGKKSDKTFSILKWTWK